jgi:hypothetical protein
MEVFKELNGTMYSVVKKKNEGKRIKKKEGVKLLLLRNTLWVVRGPRGISSYSRLKVQLCFDTQSPPIHIVVLPRYGNGERYKTI